MGRLYAWATPDYLLDYMALDEIFDYYAYGINFEEKRANLLIEQVGKALEGTGKQKSSTTSSSQKPDKQKFYELYGDQIERTPKGEG